MGYQIWSRLGFLHWRVDPESLARRLPKGLALDTYDGAAWVGLVPFTVRGWRPRGLPALPYLAQFDEVNLRTYVHRDGLDPGVWFFSLDANSLAAVIGGRVIYRLPYFHARISLDVKGETNRFRSDRPHSDGAAFECDFAPNSAAGRADPGSLEFFLAERYVFYSHSGKHLYRARIHHLPYPLQEASADIRVETLISSAGIHKEAGQPLFHYAEQVEVEVFPFRRVD